MPCFIEMQNQVKRNREMIETRKKRNLIEKMKNSFIETNNYYVLIYNIKKRLPASFLYC
jgi:hypothetical protein